MSVDANTGSTAIFGEITASLFQAPRAEVTIERPAGDVWSVLTDLSFPTVKLWNPTVVSVKHISGKPRQENELVLVTKEEAAGAPFYMRTIRMVPNQQRVLRIDTIDGSNAVFVDHSLYELNGKTKLVYSGYIETRGVPADQLKGFDFEKAAADMMDYLNHTHGLLKKAVEEKSSATPGI
jgi:hypothetical protein